MPERIYSGGGHPPTVLDRILAHPWELVIAGWSAFVGAATALSHLLGAYASPSVNQLPILLIIALAAMLVAGGLQTARGVFNNDPDLMVGYRHERVGLVLIGTAWTIYAVAVLVAFPGSISSWSSGLALGLGAAIRLWASLCEESRMRGGDS